MSNNTKLTSDDPLAAELDACRKAIDYCFEVAMQSEQIPEGRMPRTPWNKLRDMGDRYEAMDMAIKLMAASGALVESMAKAKSGGELRQAITVDRYEHWAAASASGQNLSTQNLKQRRDNARAIQNQGEGGAPEIEKQPGE